MIPPGGGKWAVGGSKGCKSYHLIPQMEIAAVEIIKLCGRRGGNKT